jgi:hypothetical protein
VKMRSTVLRVSKLYDETSESTQDCSTHGRRNTSKHRATRARTNYKAIRRDCEESGIETFVDAVKYDHSISYKKPCDPSSSDDQMDAITISPTAFMFMYYK